MSENSSFPLFPSWIFFYLPLFVRGGGNFQSWNFRSSLFFDELTWYLWGYESTWWTLESVRMNGINICLFSFLFVFPVRLGIYTGLAQAKYMPYWTTHLAFFLLKSLSFVTNLEWIKQRNIKVYLVLAILTWNPFLGSRTCDGFSWKIWSSSVP